jgi:hypothetical protein
MNSSVVKKRQLPAVKDERSQISPIGKVLRFLGICNIDEPQKSHRTGRGRHDQSETCHAGHRTGELCETVNYQIHESASSVKQLLCSFSPVLKDSGFFLVSFRLLK